MGARPSSFKKGGGFLNEVDALITGMTFESGDTYPIKKGPRKGEEFTPLSLTVSARVDGAEEDVSKRLLISDASRFGDVSADGTTLATPDGQTISAFSEAGIFINSLVNPIEGGDGFPESRLGEDDDPEITYQPVVGTRVRFIQQERTGKRAGTQTAKDGRVWPLKDLVVAKVYDLPQAAGKSNGKAAKPVAKAAKGKAVDTDEVAVAALLRYAQAAGGKIEKRHIRMKVLTDKAFSNDPEGRNTVATLLTGKNSDVYLGGLEGVMFDAEEQTVSVIEA
jgi:hypothetical protein